MAGRVTRFLGDTPGRTLLKLVIFSFALGVLMNYTGFSPVDLYDWVADGLTYLYYSGFDAFRRFFSFFLIGAMVVIPVFILYRILNWRRG